jgi:hypothetical protein
MTSAPPTDDRPELGTPAEPEHRRPSTVSRIEVHARDAVAGTCPYLLSAGGAWRSTTASRDHRCAAVDPPGPQTSDKQRRHCLVAAHVDCTLFRAARVARINNLVGGAEPASVEGADRDRRPLARTAPILLEPPRLVDQTVRLGLDRGPGQVALIALMVVAFAVVALARLSAGAAPVTPTPGPSIVAVVPSRAPTARPTSTAASSSVPSASSAAPSFRTTYKVKKGDTLSTIATKYSSTAAAIKRANALTSNTIKVGQVLKIP